MSLIRTAALNTFDIYILNILNFFLNCLFFYSVYLVELAFVNGQPMLVAVEGLFHAEEASVVAFPLGPCFVELP